ncbi:unnamed protein product [Effrenium voratum]|nr:unnamed protein product [Effrenium voratum]
MAHDYTSVLEPGEGDEKSAMTFDDFLRASVKGNRFFYCLAVFIALARVIVNMAVILTPRPGRSVFYGDHWPIVLQMTDGFLRPVLGGLSLLLFFYRFNWRSWLQRSSLAGCCLTAFISLGLEFGAFVMNEELARQEFDFDSGELVGSLWSTRIGLALVTGVKLLALGWPKTAFIGGITYLIWMGSQYNDDDETRTASPAFVWGVLVAVTAANAGALCYEAESKQQMLRDKEARRLNREAGAKKEKELKDDQFMRHVARNVFFLRLGAGLTVWDAGYLPLVKVFGHQLGLVPAFLLTFDNLFVFLSLLVLGGIVGRRGTLDPEEVLAELEHMARTNGQRIAFPGRVNSHSRHCIVSFPGRYAEEWDAAVRKVELQRGACSLACVFLTDETSGLGGHEQNPEHPGDCWCRALYGRVNAAAYISIVEDPSSMTEDELRFKEMDAKAMGQEFLRRGSQSDAEWEREKENAEAKAQEKCDKNRGLAPWGCCWFHSWKKNVDDAVALGQTLHVFYFEGKLGRGKLQWNELSRETSVAQARKDSGLGASQTAEVAYLQKCGYQFAEHDVVDFYNFMAAHRDEE